MVEGSRPQPISLHPRPPWAMRRLVRASTLAGSPNRGRYVHQRGRHWLGRVRHLLLPRFVWNGRCLLSKLEVSPELLEGLQQLSSLLESDDALHETLDGIAALPVKAIPGCDSAGVTLRVDHKVTTAAASDAFTLEIDHIQYDTRQGPCLEALETGEFREIKAVSVEDRWPEFCLRAGEKGFGSNLSFPLTANGSVGALNIYARSEHAFDEAAIALGEIFARHASIALQNAQTYAAARRLADNLNEAIQTRDMIGQAKGILMEREGVSDDKAFDMLRTISQAQNIKLREVARLLIEETLHKATDIAGSPR